MSADVCLDSSGSESVSNYYGRIASIMKLDTDVLSAKYVSDPRGH